MEYALMKVVDGGQHYDLKVQWVAGYDIDARIEVPLGRRPRWDQAMKRMRDRALGSEDGVIKPYPTLPYKIHVSQLDRSATGFYAVARFVFDDAEWRVPPPYPKVSARPRGVIP